MQPSRVFLSRPVQHALLCCLHLLFCSGKFVSLPRGSSFKLAGWPCSGDERAGHGLSECRHFPQPSWIISMHWLQLHRLIPQGPENFHGLHCILTLVRGSAFRRNGQWVTVCWRRAMFRTRGPLSREDQRGGGRGGGRGKGGEGEPGRGSNRGAGRGERGGRGLAKERWRDHSIAGEDGVADGKLYESAGKLPPFTLSGADVAHAGMLARVAEQIAWRREVILVCGDGSAYASPTALNTVLQFWALGLLVRIAPSRPAVARVRLELAHPKDKAEERRPVQPQLLGCAPTCVDVLSFF
eukprot:6190980-Pleurochrysis_carterae.AAC.3